MSERSNNMEKIKQLSLVQRFAMIAGILALVLVILLVFRPAWRGLLYGNLQKSISREIEAGRGNVVIQSLNEMILEGENTQKLYSGIEQPLTDLFNESGFDNYDAKEEQLSFICSGTLAVDKLSVKVPVFEKVGTEQLLYGASHIAVSALPGEGGTCILLVQSGDKYDKQFKGLGELSSSSLVYFVDVRGVRHVYIVKEVQTIPAEDFGNVFAQSKEGEWLAIVSNSTQNDGEKVIVWCTII